MDLIRGMGCPGKVESLQPAIFNHLDKLVPQAGKCREAIYLITNIKGFLPIIAQHLARFKDKGGKILKS